MVLLEVLTFLENLQIIQGCEAEEEEGWKLKWLLTSTFLARLLSVFIFRFCGRSRLITNLISKNKKDDRALQ